MPFSSIVLVKQVPDLNGIRVDKASGRVAFGDQLTMGSADAIAVEAALQIKEAHGGEVTVVTAGPASAREVIQRALAMGADRGIHIQGGFGGLDTLTTARLLANALRDVQFDLLFAGQSSDDYECGQVGAQSAELLGVTMVSWVTDIKIEESELVLERDTEDGKQIVIAQTPVAILAAEGLNEPRYPSLKGIMAAKKKSVDTVTPNEVPAATGIEWSEPTAPPRSTGGVMVQDKPAAEAVAELVAWLRSNKLV